MTTEALGGTKMSDLSSKRLLGLGKVLVPYVFILPPIVYLSVFMFGPLVRQVWMSLTATKLTNPNGGRFIGLTNYAELLSEPAFYNTMWVTAVYTVCSVVLAVLLGVVSALALDRPFPGRTIARGILLFGWAVPNAAAALIWHWMYNQQSGVFNQVLVSLGFDPQRWLTSVDLALPAIIVVTVWQAAPFVMLVVLAALQLVPEEVREAGRVDGDEPLNVFRLVTLPHIMPATQLAALLVTVWSIRRFDIIYLLTGGGPLNSTATLVVKIRQIAFENYDLGMASAYGVVGLGLALLVALIHFLAERRRLKAMAL